MYNSNSNSNSNSNNSNSNSNDNNSNDNNSNDNNRVITFLGVGILLDMSQVGKLTWHNNSIIDSN